MIKEENKMKVYLSPSAQERNIGYGGFNEEFEMNLIADILDPRAKELGFVIKRNKRDMSLNQIIADSNKFDPDIHVAVHSNAGGGEGTEIWVMKKGYEAEKLAKTIYKHLAPLTPEKDRGIRESGNSLGETSRTNAPAVIIEISFHDYKNDAIWMKKHREEIAESILKGMCEYAGIEYKPKAEINPDVFYRVVTGSFNKKSNAADRVAALEKAGFDSFITVYKK